MLSKAKSDALRLSASSDQSAHFYRQVASLVDDDGLADTAIAFMHVLNDLAGTGDFVQAATAYIEKGELPWATADHLEPDATLIEKVHLAWTLNSAKKADY